VLRRLLQFFKRQDYRLNSYRHDVIDSTKGLPWYVRLRLALTPSGYGTGLKVEPKVVSQYRRIIYIILALILGWFIAESALAWKFFDG
jgi:hypothetical protein